MTVTYRDLTHGPGAPIVSGSYCRNTPDCLCLASKTHHTTTIKQEFSPPFLAPNSPLLFGTTNHTQSNSNRVKEMGKNKYHSYSTNHISLSFDVTGPSVTDKLAHRLPHWYQLSSSFSKIAEGHSTGDDAATEHESILQPGFLQSPPQHQV